MRGKNHITDLLGNRLCDGTKSGHGNPQGEPCEHCWRKPKLHVKRKPPPFKLEMTQ